MVLIPDPLVTYFNILFFGALAVFGGLVAPGFCVGALFVQRDRYPMLAVGSVTALLGLALAFVLSDWGSDLGLKGAWVWGWVGIGAGSLGMMSRKVWAARSELPGREVRRALPLAAAVSLILLPPLLLSMHVVERVAPDLFESLALPLVVSPRTALVVTVPVACFLVILARRLRAEPRP